jgi:hypothetical protein
VDMLRRPFTKNIGKQAKAEGLKQRASVQGDPERRSWRRRLGEQTSEWAPLLRNDQIWLGPCSELDHNDHDRGNILEIWGW